MEKKKPSKEERDYLV